MAEPSVGSITVTVKLFAALRKYVPPGGEANGVRVTVPRGGTVADVLRALSIPAAYAGVIVSGDEHLRVDSPLEDGQELNLFPPLAGGSG
jgi:molybdopterin converting factor small subunit